MQWAWCYRSPVDRPLRLCCSSGRRPPHSLRNPPKPPAVGNHSARYQYRAHPSSCLVEPQISRSHGMQYFQSRSLADDPLPHSRQQRSCWRRERGAVLEGTEARSTPPSRRSAEKSESTLNHCCESSLGILADRHLESTRIQNPLNPQTSWPLCDVRTEVSGHTKRALKERRAKIWSRAPVPQLFSTTVEQTRAPLSQPNTLEIAAQCKHEEFGCEGVCSPCTLR